MWKRGLSPIPHNQSQLLLGIRQSESTFFRETQIATGSTLSDILGDEGQGNVTIYYHDYKNNMFDDFAKYNDL